MKSEEKVDEIELAFSEIDKFKKRLSIDKNALDDALIQQPDLYSEIGEKTVAAKSYVDSLDTRLKELRAELDANIRQDAHENEEKITEAVVANRILLTPTYKKLQRRFASWRQVADTWTVLKEACQQRSYVIKDLVALYNAEYYTVTSISSDRDSVRDARASDAREALAERRRERINGVGER